MAQSSNVSATAAEYSDNLDKWKLVDDVVNGDCKSYLRNVGASESDPVYAVARQKEYEDGAILHNFTSFTLNGMVGSIFEKPPAINLPPQLDYLIADVDGNGLTMIQQAKGSTRENSKKGRLGLLVDMPYRETAATLKDQESGNHAPRIQQYKAESIINWKTKRFGSVTKLTTIVLSEIYVDDETSDEFTTATKIQYRVLGLDADGNYYQQVYKDNDPEPMVYPRQNGKLMQSIPFFFIGSENNDYTVDTLPLIDLSNLNIGHYRNSADTEENSFICSQAMLILALSDQLDPAQFAKDNPNGVKVGSRRGLNVGAGGKAEFIQAQESDKAMALMSKKEEQAIQVGATLITPSTQVTAETARIQSGSRASVLLNISLNTSAAYKLALTECALFLGAPVDDIEFMLNTEFMFEQMTAQERAQWMAEVQMGVSPVTLFYKRLRSTGEYPEDWTDEMIEQAIAEQPPQGL